MLFLPVAFEIISGNVHLMYAAAIVLGFRARDVGADAPDEGDPRDRAALVRGAPRVAAARRRAGVHRVIARASFVLDPAAVADVGRSRRRELEHAARRRAGTCPVVAPSSAAVALVVAWGAGLTGRAWTIPIAVTLALPILWLNGLAILVACLPLSRVRVGRGAGARALGSGALESRRDREPRAVADGCPPGLLDRLGAASSTRPYCPASSSRASFS